MTGGDSHRNRVLHFYLMGGSRSARRRHGRCCDMTALKPARGIGVCVGACVAMVLLLATASGAMASSTLSLCVPAAANEPTRTPLKTGGCERNYTLYTLNVEGKEGKQGPTGPAGVKGES